MSVIFLPSASYFCHLRPIKNYWSAVSSASWGLVMHMGITGILTSQKWGSCPSLHSASMHTRSSAARVWYPHMHEASEYWGGIAFISRGIFLCGKKYFCRLSRYKLQKEKKYVWRYIFRMKYLSESWKPQKPARVFLPGKNSFLISLSQLTLSFFLQPCVFSSFVDTFFFLVDISFFVLCLLYVSLSCVRLSIQTNDFGL